MALQRRVVAVGAGAVLAALGIALGALLQTEGYLPPDPATQNAINQDAAGGYPVLLSGAIVAFGAVLAIVPLARPLAERPLPRRQAWLQRSGATAALAGSVYLLVNLAQTAYPTVAILTTGSIRRGDFANNLLAANLPALPSALLPIFALLLVALLGLLAAGRVLVQRRDAMPWDDEPVPDPAALLDRQLGLLLLATPFIGLATWGALGLVVATPGGPAGDAYRIALPVVALLLLALLGTSTLKAWQLVRYLREPRTAPLCEEAWTVAGRIEAWVVGGLALVCLAASLLKPIEVPLLETGQTFGSDLRRHVQFLLLALVPLLPAWRLQREGQRLFSGPPVRASAPTRARILWPLAAATLSLVLAGVATLALDGPVWGWLLATAPVALAAQWLRPARLGAAPLLLLAAAAWALGNTFTAHYDPTDAALIQFYGSPGVLALWRLAGAALAGVAVARLARAAGGQQPTRVAWPLAAGTGLGVAAVALLELPLSIWADSDSHGQLVQVGAAIAAQEPSVQWVMHGLATAAAVTAAILLTRLLRPEWFGRGGRQAVHAVARPIA